MLYEIRGYNSFKQAYLYVDVAHNKSEKNALIKQYKEYLQNKEIDMIKVGSYLNSGELKGIVTYS